MIYLLFPVGKSLRNKNLVVDGGFGKILSNQLYHEKSHCGNTFLRLPFPLEKSTSSPLHINTFTKILSQHELQRNPHTQPVQKKSKNRLTRFPQRVIKR